jgi:hypothetical protein
METIQMLKNVGTEYLIKCIVIKRVRERIDIMDFISPIVNNIQVNIALFKAFTTS